jgi:hypothetical protein
MRTRTEAVEAALPQCLQHRHDKEDFPDPPAALKQDARTAGVVENASCCRFTLTRPQKITFAEMRDMGVRGLLIYCADYRCSHSIAISGDRWPDDVRLSDIEARFVCQACGKFGARATTLSIRE